MDGETEDETEDEPEDGTEGEPEDGTEGWDGVDVIHFYHEPDYPVRSPAHA